MKSMFSNLTFNNIIRMLAGKCYYGDGAEDDPEAKRVRELIAEGMGCFGAGNTADYLPILTWITGSEKRIKKIASRLDEFLQGLVDERREGKEKRQNTMVDHLLCLQETQPEYYTDNIIKGIMLVSNILSSLVDCHIWYKIIISFVLCLYASNVLKSLILAGTDTSAVTLEWTLSALLNHPQILSKARDEIDNKVGLNRLVEESDLSHLPYLQNIVSESLRLYPASPLLVPHVASEDCKVGGYHMPRGTMLLTNAWAIHRDPKIWDDPTSFKPERFEKEGEAQKLLG